MLHRLAEGGEDDALLGQYLLEGGLDRYAVHDRIDGHAAEDLLLVERDAQLVERLK